MRKKYEELSERVITNNNHEKLKKIHFIFIKYKFFKIKKSKPVQLLF